MELIYQDNDIVVCVKPFGVRSTDEPGGVPDLVREALGDARADVRTVHRLDQVVGGLMVLARNKASASELSRQVREDGFGKEYLAVVHGHPEQDAGTLRDLLFRDKRERKTYIVAEPAKDVQEAILHYQTEGKTEDLSRVRIQLVTGRTHQIRAQFSGRNLPLVGDKKYSLLEDACPIALWSCRLAFTHPSTGKPMEFTLDPPGIYPWTEF